MEATTIKIWIFLIPFFLIGNLKVSGLKHHSSMRTQLFPMTEEIKNSRPYQLKQLLNEQRIQHGKTTLLQSQIAKDIHEYNNEIKTKL